MKNRRGGISYFFCRISNEPPPVFFLLNDPFFIKFSPQAFRDLHVEKKKKKDSESIFKMKRGAQSGDNEILCFLKWEMRTFFRSFQPKISRFSELLFGGGKYFFSCFSYLGVPEGFGFFFLQVISDLFCIQLFWFLGVPGRSCREIWILKFLKFH